jgi:hypothetical protein
MKRTLLILSLIAGLAAGPAIACTAEYKAQRSNPTEFRHSTMQVPADKCSVSAATGYVRSQLAASGWTLLSVVRVSG